VPHPDRGLVAPGHAIRADSTSLTAVAGRDDQIASYDAASRFSSAGISSADTPRSPRTRRISAPGGTNIAANTSTASVADTTCGHETGITGLCAATNAPGQAFVAVVTIDAAGTFTDIVFSGGAGYTIATGLVPVASGCGDQPCTTVGDGTTHMLHTDIPPGQYYLIVTGADFDTPGACGPFTMSVNGSFPVTLQAFSVT
jgi:hypothetical protein